MNLQSPLVLTGAKTEGVDLTPTKRFFKPVLVIAAPLSIEDARTLDCDYLFDDGGNARPFEGTHKLAGELANAHITLHGEVSGDVTFKTEKIAHMGCFREEKTGMKLQMRAHLPEDEAALIELLHFLSKLNKDGFTLTIAPGQRTLPGVLGDDMPSPGPGLFKFPQADLDGFYPVALAAKMPLKNKNCEAYIAVMEVEDGEWISSWSVNWKKRDVGGNDLRTDSEIYPERPAALEAAARSAWTFLLALQPHAAKEIGDHEAAIAWAQTLSPRLILERERKMKGLEALQ